MKLKVYHGIEYLIFIEKKTFFYVINKVDVFFK